MAKKRIGALLEEKGLINEFQLVAALSHQRKWKTKLGKSLMELGYLEEKPLYEVLAEQLEMELVDIKKKDIPPDVMNRFSREQGRNFMAMPIEQDGDTLVVAVSEPDRPGLRDDLEKIIGQSVKLVLATETQIESKIRKLPEKVSVASVKPVKKVFRRNHEGEIEPIEDEAPAAQSQIKLEGLKSEETLGADVPDLQEQAEKEDIDETSPEEAEDVDELPAVMPEPLDEEPAPLEADSAEPLPEETPIESVTPDTPEPLPEETAPEPDTQEEIEPSEPPQDEKVEELPGMEVPETGTAAPQEADSDEKASAEEEDEPVELPDTEAPDLEELTPAEEAKDQPEEEPAEAAEEEETETEQTMETIKEDSEISEKAEPEEEKPEAFSEVPPFEPDEALEEVASAPPEIPPLEPPSLDLGVEEPPEEIEELPEPAIKPSMEDFFPGQTREMEEELPKPEEEVEEVRLDEEEPVPLESGEDEEPPDVQPVPGLVSEESTHKGLELQEEMAKAYDQKDDQTATLKDLNDVRGRMEEMESRINKISEDIAEIKDILKSKS